MTIYYVAAIVRECVLIAPTNDDDLQFKHTIIGEITNNILIDHLNLREDTRRAHKKGKHVFNFKNAARMACRIVASVTIQPLLKAAMVVQFCHRIQKQQTRGQLFVIG